MHAFRRSRGAGRPVTPDTLGDPLFQWFSTAVALGVVGLLVLITIILTLAAQDSIRTFGLGFLTGNVWNPVPPLVFGAVPYTNGTAPKTKGGTGFQTLPVKNPRPKVRMESCAARVRMNVIKTRDRKSGV